MVISFWGDDTVHQDFTVTCLFINLTILRLLIKWGCNTCTWTHNQHCTPFLRVKQTGLWSLTLLLPCNWSPATWRPLNKVECRATCYEVCAIVCSTEITLFKVSNGNNKICLFGCWMRDQLYIGVFLIPHDWHFQKRERERYFALWCCMLIVHAAAIPWFAFVCPFIPRWPLSIHSFIPSAHP